MIITRLRLKNYGVFCGAHAIDLRPQLASSPKKPIVLIGGRNGSGKTSILDAIRVCLYGQRALGARVRRVDYETFLRDRIHRPRNPTVSLEEAAVAIEFQHVHAGKATDYLVERSWRIRGARAVESLLVKRDGKPLGDLDQDQWEDFVRDLIPPGISQLFFFDGEKIQALAEDGENLDFARSVKNLIGLDYADRLQADLDVLIGRASSASAGRAAREASAVREKELAALRAELAAAESEADRIRSTIAEQQKVIARIEERIRREGGAYAEKREEYIEKRGRLEAELAEINTHVRSLCETLLPFALAPELGEGVERRLRSESERQQVVAARTLLMSKLTKLNSALEEEVSTFEKIHHQTRGKISRLLKARVREILSLDAVEAHTDPVFDVSEGDARRLQAWIREVQTKIPELVQDLEARLERATRARARVEQRLRAAPADDVLRPLLEELNAAHADLGRMEQAARQQEAAIERFCTRITQNERETRKAREEAIAAQGEVTRVRLMKSVQEVLSRFEARLTEEKLSDLSDRFVKCFNRLARKDELVEQVRIDPVTFEVLLVDSGGRALPKRDLSAGEKQIYAIAMLWALAQTSGRPLPLIIDTPLGRLDADHRRRLIEGYFPEAAHQVIILSTDTEIDRIYFEGLAGATARSYRLEFIEDWQHTVIEPGYFWDGGTYERASEMEPASA